MKPENPERIDSIIERITRLEHINYLKSIKGKSIGKDELINLLEILAKRIK